MSDLSESLRVEAECRLQEWFGNCTLLMMTADRIEQLENIISGWEGQNPAKAKYAFEKQSRRIEELERENAALKRKLCPNSHEGLDWCSCGWRSAKMALREQEEGNE